MPSLLSIILRAQIKLISPLIANATLEQTRRTQDALGRLGVRAVEGSVHFGEATFEQFEASWAIPIKGQVRQAIVYLHGGAYSAGGLPYAQGFGGMLAANTNRAVLCVGYRLAPEHPFPAALEDALSAYRSALERFAPEDIALVGESAGGGLCYCLALRLKELGLPQPGHIVAVSPWCDLTMHRDVSAVQKNDPLLDHATLVAHAKAYAGGFPTRHPLLSPIYGDLAGLPPSLIIAGGDEIIVEDIRQMARGLIQAGCVCRLHVEEGLWHVYVLYGVPEAKEAIEMITSYLAHDAPQAFEHEALDAAAAAV